MDALREHDVELNREALPSEKLAQALELMSAGIRLKRVAVQQALPNADDQEIERAIERWLLSDA